MEGKSSIFFVFGRRGQRINGPRQPNVFNFLVSYSTLDAFFLRFRPRADATTVGYHAANLSNNSCQQRSPAAA